jgi:signal transduction histidine kinase
MIVVEPGRPRMRELHTDDPVDASDRRASSRATGGGLLPAPPSIAREMAIFAAASLLAVVLFAVAAVQVFRHEGRSEAIRNARATAQLAAAGVVEPALRDELLRGDPDAVERMDRVVQERILSDSIVRVKIWGPDGRILYSDEPRLIGARYALGADEREALASGLVNAELSDLSQPENRFERPEGELLEVYLRVRTPSGEPVLFELYERFDSVIASGRRIWLAFLPALLAALVLLWLVQLPLVYRLARRVRRGHEEREALLRRTLDASNDERRRIAGDLHDSVVQDLAGTSYSLAAAATSSPSAQEDPALQRTLREAAEVTRASMQRLRGLLVAIHPPNLRASGLEAALVDELAPLERRGIHVALDVQDDARLGRETEELVFRVAREAIRNVAAHAEAEHVTVRVVQQDGRVRLTVADDGAGFSPAERERRRAEGHLGLSLVEAFAEHAGGRVDVTSAPGEGTTVTLEVAR